MGKHEKLLKQTLLSDYFVAPATNPFEETPEETYSDRLLSDLIGQGACDAELDFESEALAEMQTTSPFPSWNPLPEQPAPEKEATGVPEPADQPAQAWHGDKATVYEYDIADHLANHYPTGLYQGIPYIRTDGVDVVLSNQKLGSLIIESMPLRKTRKVSAASFKHIHSWLQSILDRKGQTLERDRRLVLFENGCYDLWTGHKVPESLLSGKFFPVKIRASYDPDMVPETPVFDSFLEQCSGGDPEIQRLMLEYLAYMLAPCDPETIILMAPTAGSGKSVFANFVREILGVDKTCAIALANFGKSFEVSQIFGKVGNFCLDISSAVLSDSTVATIKRLTGGDAETINAKFRDPFPYNNFAKLTFACNEGGIRLRNPDSGFERRLVVIPFLHAVPKNLMDKHLKEKLWEERDGIIWHAMKALKQLHRRGYAFSSCRAGELLKRQYLGIAEASVQDFIDELCDLSPDEQSWTSTLYEAYLGYCKENQMHPVGRKRFSQLIFSIPSVHAHKFQKNHTQLQGARGIALKSL